MPRHVVASGRSCLECRRRKIRCDRSFPCAYCVRTRIQCSYPPKPDGEGDTHSDLASRVEIIANNVESLERSLILSFPFNLGLSSLPYLLHPPPPMVAFIWQTYLESIDPVFKLFHAPTVQKHVMKVIQGQVNLDAPMQCLMFAIYYSTLAILTETVCRKRFHEDKATLLEKFQTRVEQALLKANFLNTLDITVLQALVLYLFQARRVKNESNTLIGLAIGTAMRIGLHRDGASQGRPPFDVEMRRRLWWQIYTLESQIAEAQGIESSYSESIFDTELPSNIDDINLDPNTSELQSQLGKTEMTFTLTWIELGRFVRSNVLSSGLSETHKVKAMERFREQIEKEFLMRCDRGIPFDKFTVASTRLMLLKFQLMACKPQANETNSMHIRVSHPNEQYWTSCTRLLQHAHGLRHCDKERRWIWLLQTDVEWDALSYLLLGLCLLPLARPSNAEVWKIVGETYQDWRYDLDISRDRRWRHIEELRSQSLAVRDRMHIISQRSEAFEPGVATCQGSPAAFPRTHDVGFNEPPSPRTSTRHDSTEPDSATARPTPDLPLITVSELPGTGTACEWSAGLFQRYWDIAERNSSA
ncbi:fungal-specific transcription factor domain-containing protein [Aspergillus avenaceus]|uniref:Fungal-specific transcription factor domain-containing protein n=1 Tax=Aspergillus avenaceus TaxID=36643 RepID=A0A5N6TLB9_ASPAV|nr:fungal-specific transcription factor domain-containing protein [Aspergillus avenaceus]